MSNHDYVAKVGDMATITLPGEITRGVIERTIGPAGEPPKKIIVRLATFTTSKDHNYRRGDHVPCRLIRNGYSQLAWEAIPESELREAAEKADAEAKMPPPADLPAKPAEEASFVLGEN